MGGVAIEHGGVASSDLSRVIDDDHLSHKGDRFLCRVRFRIRAYIASLELTSLQLHVETNVVTGTRLVHVLVVHFNGSALGLSSDRGELQSHSGAKNTSLHSASRHRAKALDVEDVLDGNAQGLVSGSSGRLQIIQSLQESGSIVPLEIGGTLNHVVPVPPRDRDERDVLGVVANSLEVVSHLVPDFVESVLGPVDGLLVHLIDAANDLLDAQSVGQEKVLLGLAHRRDTGLELTSGGGDHDESTISLRGSGDHVLDEIPVSRGVNDGDVVFVGAELPKRVVDSDSLFSLILQLIEDPGVFEGSAVHSLGLLFVLLDGSLVDSSQLVNKVARGSALAGIDMANNNDVDVILCFLHVSFFCLMNICLGRQRLMNSL